MGFNFLLPRFPNEVPPRKSHDSFTLVLAVAPSVLPWLLKVLPPWVIVTVTLMEPARLA